MLIGPPLAWTDDHLPVTAVQSSSSNQDPEAAKLICDAFYRRATDKSEAVRRIIRMTDAEAFLRESGYAGGSH